MMKEHVDDELGEGVEHRNEDQTGEDTNRDDDANTQVVLKWENHYADIVNNIDDSFLMSECGKNRTHDLFKDCT